MVVVEHCTKMATSHYRTLRKHLKHIRVVMLNLINFSAAILNADITYIRAKEKCQDSTLLSPTSMYIPKSEFENKLVCILQQFSSLISLLTSSCSLFRLIKEDFWMHKEIKKAEVIHGEKLFLFRFSSTTPFPLICIRHKC